VSGELADSFLGHGRVLGESWDEGVSRVVQAIIYLASLRAVSNALLQPDGAIGRSNVDVIGPCAPFIAGNRYAMKWEHVAVQPGVAESRKPQRQRRASPARERD
jgi:hypothetical protein